MLDPADAAELASLAARIDAWADRELAANPLVAHVERVPDERRWLIRMRGEEKSAITVWLWLREWTLQFETGFMPSPEERREELFEYLLRLNNRLYGMRFAIGDEDAVYLVGQLPVPGVNDDELDRILGATYHYVEQYFRGAMAIGYASRFRR